jgi:Spy/CpxP family protein refolding chaperone
MKSISLLGLSLFTLALTLILPRSARADDTTVVPPPPLPDTPQASPADGTAPHHRHRSAGFVLGELTAKLNLTPDQQKTVGAIIENSRSQGRALREDTSLTPEARRQQMKEIQQTARTQIRAALNPSQQQTFDQLPLNRGAQPSPGGAAEPTPTPST